MNQETSNVKGGAAVDLQRVVSRLRDEAALCRNETATDVADILEEGAAAIEALREQQINQQRRYAIELLAMSARIFKETGCSLGAHTVGECVRTLHAEGCDSY